MPVEDPLVKKVIGCAIQVHREIGPGLLESSYQRCMRYELEAQAIPFRTEIPLPLTYRGKKLDCGYRLDLLVEGWLVVEVKSVARLLPIHTAQVITYIRLAGGRQGLIFNFNEARMKDGIRSVMPFGWRNRSEEDG